MLSSYCDFIVVRTVNHSDLLEIARSSRSPVINALTKLEHPTQALADVYTIIKAKGRVDGLRIAFMGDISQNTCNSLMITAAKLGANISLVGPASWKPEAESYSKALSYGNRIEISDSVEEGLHGADIIYTDTFVSMGDDAEHDVRLKSLHRYQLNAGALLFAPASAKVMHPLPAHRGEEVTGDVIDGPQSIVWEQASNKLLLEKALLIFLERSTA
jgi:ornithine carbamoyltransferase